MDNKTVLKNARDITLKLHKSLIDREREIIEARQGVITPGQFLKLLLEDENFAWLRSFSNLIVVTDELFAQKDGYSDDEVSAILSDFDQVADLGGLSEADRDKVRLAMQDDENVAALIAELKSALKEAN